MGGLVKRGGGTLTLSAAPAYTGTTTLAGGVLVVPQGTVVEELSCLGGKLTVPLADNEADTPVLTIASLAAGTTVEDLEAAVAVNGATTSVEAGEGGYIVKATRTGQTLTWTGAVDTNWATPGNWSIGGVSTSLVPVESDKVVFPALAENASAWQVTLSSTPTVTNVTANGDVTLTGALIRTETVEGSATITLGDSAGFRTYDYLNAVMTISANIEANGSAEHPNEIRGYYTTKSGAPDKGGTTVTFSGNLTGTGTLKIIGCRCTNALSGDYTAFAGHLWVVSDGVGRNKTYLESANTTSSNAIWTVYNDTSDCKFLRFGSQTVHFGALNGTVYQSTTYYNNIFEIGAANVDCSFGGKLGATQQNHITKVGSATLTFSGSDMGNLVIKSGVFAAQNQQSMPKTSMTFAGEGGFFDPVTNTVDFAAKIVNSTEAPIGLLITNDVSIGEIPASNTAGLTKKGAGTLELTAVPLYTGLTTVEEGALVLPSDSDIVFNPFSAGTLSGVTPTRFAYPVNTTLTGSETWKSFEGTLDIANVTAIDVSAATLKNGQPYVVASATAITGYNKAKLNAIELTLPDGVDASKWVLKVMAIGNARCLCIAPATTPFKVILR
jgi:autotransporter-associated beta strand protein